jgi:cation transport ATPase
MKTICRILFITIVIFFVPITTYSQSQSNSKGDTLSFIVYGMDCPGCEGGLEKQVNKIPSVEISKANWVKQELKVVVKQDSTLDLAELEKRVKKANFTLSTEAKKEESEE